MTENGVTIRQAIDRLRSRRFRLALRREAGGERRNAPGHVHTDGDGQRRLPLHPVDAHSAISSRGRRQLLAGGAQRWSQGLPAIGVGAQDPEARGAVPMILILLLTLMIGSLN